MPQQDLHATEPNHTGEVLSMKFVADNQSAEPVQPSKQPLHDPAAQLAPQRSAVPRSAPVLTVGRNHLDSVFPVQMPVQRVRVIRLVADRLFAQLVEQAAGQLFVDRFRLVRRGRVDRDSQRKAVSRGDGHDLRPLAPLGFARREAPFFAAAKRPSIKPSPGSSFPSRCSLSASAQSPLQLPAAHPLLEAPVHGLVRRILLRQLPPRCCRAQNPKRSVQQLTRIGRRPTPPVSPLVRWGNRNNGSNTAHSPSDTSPGACIYASRIHQSHFLCAALEREIQEKTAIRYLSDRC